jgi:hypothetical protein
MSLNFTTHLNKPLVRKHQAELAFGLALDLLCSQT